MVYFTIKRETKFVWCLMRLLCTMACRLTTRYTRVLTLTNRLLGVLLKFRQDPVALVADIEGMFNQVKVLPDVYDALRFLRWEDSNLEQPSEFQMTSHIFGPTDSPSCANFVPKESCRGQQRKIQ